MEEALVNNIYLLAYQILKKEFQLTGTSTLLPRLTDIDNTYIETYLLKEIQSLSLNPNSVIQRKINQIEMEGLETEYLNEELLILLLCSSQDLNYSKETEEENKLSQIQSESILEIREGIQNLTQKFEKNKRKLTKIKLGILKKRLMLASYYGVILEIGIGSFFAKREDAKEKHYYTIEENYHPGIEPYFTTPYYEPQDKDTVSIIKYYPYQKLNYWQQIQIPEDYDQNSKFAGKVEIYDVSEIKFENIKDYLELDLESLGAESIDTMDYKVYLTPQDTFQEPYTIVKRTTHNLDDYTVQLNIDELKASMLSYLSLEFGLLYVITSTKQYRNLKKALKDAKENKKSLEEKITLQIDALKEYEKELSLATLEEQYKDYISPSKLRKRTQTEKYFINPNNNKK